MNTNLTYAVALSVAFLGLWYYFGPRLAEQTAQDSVSSAPGLPGVKTPASQVEQAVPFGGESADDRRVVHVGSRKKSSVSIVQSEKVVDLASARIVFNSMGASVKHWWLKEENGKEGEVTGEEHWPDLVNHPYETEEDLLSVKDYPLSTFPDLNYRQTGCRQGMGEISCWKAVLPSGLEIEKKYAVEKKASQDPGSSNFLNLFISFKNRSKEAIEIEGFKVGWTMGLGTIVNERKENKSLIRLLAYPSPKKEVVELDEGDHAAGYSWMGVDNRYYLFAMMPQLGNFDRLQALEVDGDPASLYLTTKKVTLDPGEKKSFEIKIYAGPKGYTHLKNRGLGLEHAVDFGYFGFLGKTALKALYWLYGLTNNYGWAIIILTCIMQVIIFPLSAKSYKSMASMKKQQPKIQELQNRYKGDSKRISEETMKLYKETGTNPFGGCLPMILQIPIFWAFFTMLRNSYELRGAPWIFWIQDLSLKDPYYVLPIVMGGGMYVQQKISGATGDATQAKIMQFLPIIFTFMFLNFPSGLVLYWLTNSILSTSTQYWFKVRADRKQPAYS